ncbi:MAG TPA: hemolysin III family protein, partial [Egibacteraceae bacterium]
MSVPSGPALRVPGRGRADGRPWLRGVVHAGMVPVTLAGMWALLRAASEHGTAGRVTAGLFGALLVGLYTVSSLYHVPPWPARVRAVLARLDGAMIQLFIAGSFTPVAFFTLDGGWRTWSLVGAWVIGITGAVIAASSLQAPRWLGTLGYIAVGWLTVVPFTRAVAALPWQGSSLIVLGGVLYTLGAIVYVRRWPDPLPTWFGYHEIFHLFVV